jgi:hypothetical protein
MLASVCRVKFWKATRRAVALTRLLLAVDGDDGANFVEDDGDGKGVGKPISLSTVPTGMPPPPGPAPPAACLQLAP